jgi:hypothetical protein
MGVLITEGFYNNEVNAYKAYGMEPNDTDAGHHVWGHFSQVIVSAYFRELDVCIDNVRMIFQNLSSNGTDTQYSAPVSLTLFIDQ